MNYLRVIIAYLLSPWIYLFIAIASWGLLISYIKMNRPTLAKRVLPKDISDVKIEDYNSEIRTQFSYLFLKDKQDDKKSITLKNIFKISLILFILLSIKDLILI